ncbi:MAG TPA: hypothetical protein VK718_01250 [Ferruginibacter sp.]|jgi:hypothetical protein|nr:hypothetical protein [Ferruginibacter sp.]
MDMEPGMEPDVREFLVRIMQTISMSIVWLLVNMTIGIYYDLAFFVDKPSIWNYLFYIWFLTSFGFLLYYFYKKWKGKL